MNLRVPPYAGRSYVRGESPVIQPGDLVLVRHHGLLPAAIRLAERLRRPRGVPRAEWRVYCRVNHACIALSGGSSPTVAQATARGIVVSSLADVGAYSLAVVHIFATARQQSAVVEFARDSIGSGYGWAQIGADGLNAALGLELSLGWGDRMVCSTAAARALERTDFIPERAPSCVTPAHLAWYFEAVVAAA